jgi:microcystin degradation protein MlrC
VRLFVTMMSHQTNTFSTIPTDRAQFEARSLHYGDEIVGLPRQTLDPEMMRIVGLDPLAHKILVVRSTIHYRAAFEPLAREIIEVDAPGLSSSNLAASTSSASAGRSSRSTRR